MKTIKAVKKIQNSLTQLAHVTMLASLAGAVLAAVGTSSYFCSFADYLPWTFGQALTTFFLSVAGLTILAPSGGYES